MVEQWRDVVGYEGLYKVSDLGKVRSVRRRRLLRPGIKSTGYAQVTLSRDGVNRYYSVHRIVAAAFLPNPNALPQVNHKNGKKQDNRLANLEWCSASENQQHKYKVLGKSGGHPKAVFCIETGQRWEAVHLAAQELNIHRTSISMVCHGRRKTAGGLHFKFLEE